MRLQITVDDEFGEELKKQASDLGFSVSSYIRYIIKKSVNKKNFIDDGLSDLQNARVEEISLEDFKKQLESNINA